MFSFFSPIIPSLSPLSSSRKSQNDETNANHRWPAQESAQQLCPYLLGSASRTHEPKRERKGKERKGKAAAVTLRRSRLYGYHGVERREHCGARSQPNKKKKRKETERERERERAECSLQMYVYMYISIASSRRAANEHRH